MQKALQGTLIETYEVTDQNAHWIGLLELCILSTIVDSMDDRSINPRKSNPHPRFKYSLLGPDRDNDVELMKQMFGKTIFMRCGPELPSITTVTLHQ